MTTSASGGRWRPLVPLALPALAGASVPGQGYRFARGVDEAR